MPALAAIGAIGGLTGGAATAAGALTLGSAAAGIGGSIYGAHAASSASKRASDVTAQNDAAQIAYQKQHDAQLAQQEQAKQDFAKAQWDAQQKLLADREARLAPYRAASAAALGSLGNMLGFQFNATSAPSAPSAPGVTPAPMPGSTKVGPPQFQTMGPAPTSAPMSAPRPAYNPTSVLPGGMIDPWTVQPLPVPGTLGDQLRMVQRPA